MSDPLNLTLLTTCARDQPGSMRRYADLVEQGLKTFAPELEVRRVDLAVPTKRLSGCPPFMRNRLHHLLLYRAVCRLRATRPRGLLHLLDGSYGYLLHALPAGRCVVTCHDLIPHRQCLGMLGLRPAWPARRLIESSRKGLSKAAHIVADCEGVRREISTLAAVPLERISACGLPLADMWWERPKQEMERTHILHVGNAAFYKNRPAVLRIFAQIAKSWPGRLVMAGASPDDGLRDPVESLGLKDRVDFVPNPDDEELMKLYQTAKIFLFPSLIEGYGWPPLEAVACGCPVVASDVGGIKEVLGPDGGRFFDPADETGMASACLELLNHPDDARARVTAGQAAVERVTLEGMSRSLINVYQQVLTCA